MACNQRAANVAVSRIIPVFLTGIIGYGSWVVTKRVCIDYLINPPRHIQKGPQKGVAAAILAIYYVLLIPVLATFGRLIHTILINPGYVARGPQWHRRQSLEEPQGHNARKHRGWRNDSPKDRKSEKAGQSPPSADEESASFGKSSDTTESFKDEDRPEDFWLRDVFVCNYDGRPAWCSTCLNYKPDRTHHCSEVNRCIRKMDHFCPWVGGIIGENAFKLFVQFVGHAALLTLHLLVVMAVYTAEMHKKTGNYDVNWVVILAISALFFLFTSGMFTSSMQFVLLNTTTVENLTRKTKIWYIAVLIPRPADGGPPRIPFYGRNNPKPPTIRTITYPRPPEEHQLLEKHNGSMPSSPPPATSSISTPPIQHQPNGPTQTSTAWSAPPRTFAILETRPGENPFDLGPWRNFQQVMGYKPLDWILPFKRSPCTDHSSAESAFPMGPVVESLKKEAGLIEGPPENPGETEKKFHGRQHRRRRRHRDDGAGHRRHRHHHRHHGQERQETDAGRSPTRGSTRSGGDQEHERHGAAAGDSHFYRNQ